MPSHAKKASYLPEKLSFLPRSIPIPGDLVQCLPLKGEYICSLEWYGFL